MPEPPGGAPEPAAKRPRYPETSDGFPLRLFVALTFSRAVQRGCGQLVERLRSEYPEASRAVQWVEPPLMHLTVKFLGPVDRDGVDRLQGVLGNVAAGRGPFRLSLSRGGLFTRYGQPATLLLDLPEREGGRREFQELAAAVDGACRSAGFRAAKTPLEHLASPQKPHVTIGRVRKKLDGASAEQLMALGVALGGLSLPEPLVEEVRELVLLRSDPAGGPEYTVMESWPLVAPGRSSGADDVSPLPQANSSGATEPAAAERVDSSAFPPSACILARCGSQWLPARIWGPMRSGQVPVLWEEDHTTSWLSPRSIALVLEPPADLREGEAVEAQCPGWGNNWFRGTIRGLLEDGDVDVLWDDSDTRSIVPLQAVRRIASGRDQGAGG